MGNRNSRPKEVTLAGKVMPSYYIANAELTDADVKMARDSWELVMESKSDTFMNAKNNDPNFEFGSCLAWFYDSFYQRLFTVYPSCRPLFKGDLQIQGRALVRMISVCLDQLTDKELVSSLQKLAKTHAQRGVVVNEYFLVGEVLLWTFDCCLGPQFDGATKEVWVKIYSRMLAEIVPVAVREEAALTAATTP